MRLSNNNKFIFILRNVDAMHMLRSVVITETAIGHFEKWLQAPPEAEFEMAQDLNVFIIG